MARNRKFFVHNTALLVSSRIEEGLPLVPTHCLNEILWGILARGQRLYPVRVCHFVFMANHFHMMLVVHNPEDVSCFTGYVKAEITHAVNRLLGRVKRSIWDKGYDSPVVLTPQDIVRYIQYIYTNPTKPGLVDSIDEYPGVSSWGMYQSGNHSRVCKHINRDEIPQLPYAALSVNEQKKITEVLLSREVKGSAEQFYLEPDAWLDCFDGLGEELPPEAEQDAVISGIRAQEESYKAARTAEKKYATGATELRRRSMLKEHVPEKRSRRMICLCSDKELRWRFISHFRELCQQAADIYERWKLGETRLRMPPGILSPYVPQLASAVLRVT